VFDAVIEWFDGITCQPFCLASPLLRLKTHTDLELWCGGVSSIRPKRHFFAENRLCEQFNSAFAFSKKT